VARTREELVEFIRAEGMVLQSAKGPVPSLAAYVVGAPVAGSWWAHPQGKAIFAALQAVRASPDVLACRLVNGKVTLVHRRLWPALLAASSKIPSSRTAVIEERHTPLGKHEASETPLADWAPDDVRQLASRLTVDEALRALEAIAPLLSTTR
jgi:hypothetical protein